MAAPAIRQGRLFIGDIDGKFLCLRADTGAKLWEFSAEAEIDSSANFYKDRVLFGSQDATLYCLRQETGELLWKHQIEDQIRCSPTVMGNRCFVAGCDARLHVIDLETGNPVGQGVPIDSPTGVTPAAVGDYVFFGTEGGEMLSVNWKESAVAWRFVDGKRALPFRSSPAVTSKRVIFRRPHQAAVFARLPTAAIRSGCSLPRDASILHRCSWATRCTSARPTAGSTPLTREPAARLGRMRRGAASPDLRQPAKDGW